MYRRNECDSNCMLFPRRNGHKVTILRRLSQYLHLPAHLFLAGVCLYDRHKLKLAPQIDFQNLTHRYNSLRCATERHRVLVVDHTGSTAFF